VLEQVAGQWQQRAKLTAGEDAAVSDEFGIDVAISGNTVVVGAWREDDMGEDAGAAYVFTGSGSTWTLQEKLVGWDNDGADFFGHSVGIDGDTIVVGAYAEDSAATDAGAAYTFERTGSTWNQGEKLTAPAADAQASDIFGHDVAIDGDTIVIGAHGDDTLGNGSGAVYMFQRSGGSWNQTDKLVAPEGGGLAFGVDADLDDNLLVVGASAGDRAYIYERSGGAWSYETRLLGGDQFGSSVAVSGELVLVGAYLTGSNDPGEARLYQRMTGGEWLLQEQITPAQQQDHSQFGLGVAIDGDELLIGARRYDRDAAIDAGAVYSFHTAPLPDTNNSPQSLNRWWGTAGSQESITVDWNVYLPISDDYLINLDFILPIFSGTWHFDSDPQVFVDGQYAADLAVGSNFASAQLPILPAGNHTISIDGLIAPDQAGTQTIRFLLERDVFGTINPDVANLTAAFIADHPEILSLSSTQFNITGIPTPLNGVDELIGYFAPILHYSDEERYAVPLDVTTNQPTGVAGGTSATATTPIYSNARISGNDGSNGGFLDLNPWAVGEFNAANDTLTPAIYASVLEDTTRDELAINYYFFYPRSNWAEHDGRNTHEGDWEGVSVFLGRNGNSWEPQRLALAQHEQLVSLEDFDGVDQITDWTSLYLSEAPGLAGGQHPHLFPGLGGHATYASRDTTSVFFVDEVHQGDGVGENAAGELAALEYVPSSQEVHYLPRIGISASGPNLDWLRYPGDWGKPNTGAPGIPGTNLGNDGPSGPAFGNRWLDPWEWASSFDNNPNSVPVEDQTPPVAFVSNASSDAPPFAERDYIDVVFVDDGASGLFHSTILDLDTEFTLLNKGLTSEVQPLRQSPKLIDTVANQYTYRYFLTDTISTNSTAIQIIPGSFSDNNRNLNSEAIQNLIEDAVGITILIHGYNLSGDGIFGDTFNPIDDYWNDRNENVEAILQRFGGGRAFAYEPDDGTFVQQVGLPGSQLEQLDKSIRFGGHVVLAHDWSFVSNDTESGQAEAAADALFAALIQHQYVTPQASTSIAPLHIIGHSRGASVASELIQRLGFYKIDVAYFTSLDPHDFDEDGFSPVPFDGSFHDPAVQIWDNVDYADNYWQVSSVPGVPSGRQLGHLVDGYVHDHDLTPLIELSDGPLGEGDGTSHGQVIDWYFGTVAIGRENPLWYSSNLGATATGFQHWISQGGFNSSYALPIPSGTVRPDPTLSSISGLIPYAAPGEENYYAGEDNGSVTFFNGNFDLPDLSNQSLAGWHDHGGDSGLGVFSSALGIGFDGFAAIDTTATHNRMYFPFNRPALSFKYSLKNVGTPDSDAVTDDWLVVHVGGVELRRFNLSQLTIGTSESDIILLPVNPNGFVDTLHFEIDAGSTPGVNAGVLIDDIKFLTYENLLALPDDDNDGAPGAIEENAPNSGDGNFDGVPDSEQTNVASYPNAINGDFVTLATSADQELANAAAKLNPAPFLSPSNFAFAEGFLEFDINSLPSGAPVTLDIVLHSNRVPTSYWKFGPTPDNVVPHWYEFLYDPITQTGAKITSKGVISVVPNLLVITHFP